MEVCYSNTEEQQ